MSIPERVAAALTAALAATLLASNAATAQIARAVPPLSAGPFPVACANIEQDFSRVPAGESAEQFWKGEPRGSGAGRYVTDLIADPLNALQLTVQVPDRRELFRNIAGQRLPYALLVCYPTDSSNSRLDYPLPPGGAVPRMQRGGELPIFPETFAATRWPLLVYAHGLGGSPLSQEYLQTLALFAGHGYVVMAPFFADARIADVQIENLGEALTLLTKLDRVIEMQAVRPFVVSQALDYLLAHPHWRDSLDAARIGGFGASLGGMTMLLLGGAQLTTSVGLAARAVTFEPRLKAAVGYVPYFGQRIYPAFGDDQNGLDSVTLPFLGISGTGDSIVPIAQVEQGINRMQGSRFLVEFAEARHGLDPAHVPDLYTWAVTFLDAFVNDNPAARASIATMTSVLGGAADSTRIDYAAPLPAAAGERTVVEYRSAQLDHYFITAEPDEALMLDAGIVVSGWTRTGLAHKARTREGGAGSEVCRFFGTPGLGPNSHFFTADARECMLVRGNPFWTFEGIAFRAFEPPAPDQCPDGRIPVYRIYNDGKGGEANHRYTTSRSIVAQMKREQWRFEGTVFCAAP